MCSIVFIHGLNGNRERTWRAEGASEPWIKSLLPSEIPKARVLAFGYDATVRRGGLREVVSQSRVTNHAMNLLTSLVTLRAKDGTVSLPRSARHKQSFSLMVTE